MPNDLQSQSVISVETTSGKDSGARTYLIFLCVLATVLAFAYVGLARPGSAGDEPAHFQNVIFYAQHKCAELPVLGQPGVSYEGQMGPLYYMLSAPVFGAFLPIVGERGAFFATRIFDVLLVPLTVLLSYRIACLMKPDDRPFALATTTFMALNPSLLSIAASIQNDSLTLVLAMLTSVACFKCMQTDRHAIRNGVIIGCLAGLAILTKATAVFLVAAVPVYAAICWRWRSAKFTVSFIATVTLVTGWWFLRNVAIYGDLTAQAALTKFNYHNNPPPFDFLVWPNFRYWIWSVETYYWLPIQYYRDIFHTPIWLRSVVGILTACGLVGSFSIASKYVKDCIEHKRLHSYFALFLAAQYLVCMTIYVYSCMRITNFAARVTFPTIVFYAAIIAGGCFVARRFKKSENIFLVLLAVGLIAGNIYVLQQLVLMPVFEFHNIFQPTS